ncbi:MAG: tetratricopeptide repeat protein [Sciscionella sp.]
MTRFADAVVTDGRRAPTFHEKGEQVRRWFGVLCAVLLLCCCAQLTVTKLPDVPAWVAVLVAGAASAVLAAGSSTVTQGVGKLLSPPGNRALRDRFESGPNRGGPGRVRQADALLLGVHEAEENRADPRDRVPAYVRRDAHGDLVAALRAGGFVLIEGRAASGKTRLAFEAMREAFPDYLLLVPHDGQALLELKQAHGAPRRSLIFLDNLERFTGGGALDWGVIEKLCFSRRDRIILATLRPDQYPEHRAVTSPPDGSAIPSPLGEICAHPRTVLVRIDAALTEAELFLARSVGAHDARINAAIENNETGFGAHICGGIAALKRWRAAQDGRQPVGAALVHAAIDCRRAGYRPPVPKKLLEELFGSYIADDDRNAAEFADVATGLAWATERFRGLRSLIPRPGESFEVEDYLLDCVQADPASPPVPDQVWQTIIAFTQPDADILYSVGNAAVQVERLAQAEGAWSAAATHGHVKAMTNLGMLLTNLGRGAEALPVLRRAAEAGQSRAMNSLGLLLMQDGQYDQAERWFRRSATLGETPALFNLGILSDKRGLRDRAEGFYRRAVEAGEDLAALNLGILLYAAGRIDEAELFYRHAAGVGDVVAMYNLGVVLQEKGRVAEAEGFYRPAADRGDAGAMCNLGALLWHQRKFAESEAFSQHAAELGNSVAMHNLGLHLKQQGRFADSEAWLLRCADCGYPAAFTKLGDLMDRLERYDEATEWYQRAVDAGLDDRWNLARLLRILGRVDEADAIEQQKAG